MMAQSSHDRLFDGFLGRFVGAFKPHTEADPIAIALQFLVALGNAVGRAPSFRVGETVHHLNEFLVVVGASSRARKGDGKNTALRSLESADPSWAERVASGLSSGEGLIASVCDPLIAATPGTGQPRMLNPGVPDKRLLVVETEFVTALKQFQRQGNILSAVLRDAWDGKQVLRTLTRQAPLSATDAHISLIAHTTPQDLHAHLANVEAANGFGNRCLFLLTHRAQILPIPGRPPASLVAELTREISEILKASQQVSNMTFTASAETHWRAIYPILTKDHPGLLGSLLARAEAHVVRLAALFALLARCDQIDAPHLESGLAVWGVAEASTRQIFAQRSGDDTADRVRNSMLPGQTLTLTEIRDQIFSNHVSAPKLRDALELLTKLDDFSIEHVQTGGRSEIRVCRRENLPQNDSVLSPGEGLKNELSE